MLLLAIYDLTFEFQVFNPWVGRRAQATIPAGQRVVDDHHDHAEDGLPEHVNPNSPVWAWNEWDPLEEVIVGRVEGASVPPFTVEVKVSNISSCAIFHL